jgi:hypothetical protein
LNEIQAGEKKIPVPQVAHQRIKTSLTIKRLFWVSFTILLMTISIWYLMHVSKKSSPISNPAVKSLESPPQVKESIHPIDSASLAKKTFRDPVPEKTTALPSLRKESGVEIEAGNKENHQTKIIQHKEIPQLTLKGILWSHLPARRVAIINSSHLKEGDKIQGVTVLKIGKNSVTLQADDKKWKIYLR